MKKLVLIPLCVIIIWLGAEFLFTHDPCIPGGYTYAEEHYDPDGFQDYTDFCFYRYGTGSAIEKNKYYSAVGEADVDALRGYFENFEGWMKAEDRLSEYTFDTDSISAGDYCIIETKEGQPIGQSEYGKYDSYTVYFFDTESLTLYYIHTNI